LRLSPLYQRLKDKGAVYGSKNGWERPLWFAPDGVVPVDQLDFLNPGWWPFVDAEQRAVRQGVTLTDQSSFSKFELLGPGALAAIQRLAVSNMDKPLGTVIYTQLCNERGGIEADVTITRLAANHFYIVTGAGFGVHDSDWINRYLPDDAVLVEVTSARGVINIAGPLARDVLAAASESDVSNAAFPFATCRDIFIGAAPVRAIRIGYVGELGWELHVPSEFAVHVYDLLWENGQAHGIRDIGYRAIDGLRLEKGYLYWSADITPDYTPIEAGLGFVIDWTKGDFLGRAALAKIRAAGVKRRLVCLALEQPLHVFGGEAILSRGKVVGQTTSGCYGYTVGQSLVLGYLPVEVIEQGEFTVNAFGTDSPARLIKSSAYDPQRLRILV